MWMRALVLAAILSGWSGQVQAQGRAAAPAADRWQDVLECRKETDPSRRLACMDAAIAAAEAAERSGELVVRDRSQVETKQREEFGLRTPRPEDPVVAARKVNEVRSTITFSRFRPYEREWVIALADGSVWRQIGTEEIYKTPRIGLPVEITRGMLGNFFLVVDGATAIRVRRVK
jgi:hypothetical protein